MKIRIVVSFNIDGVGKAKEPISKEKCMRGYTYHNGILNEHTKNYNDYLEKIADILDLCK